MRRRASSVATGSFSISRAMTIAWWRQSTMKSRLYGSNGSEPTQSTTRSTSGRFAMATELKPIRSSADYEAALAEAERLWGAKSGTPKGDRLDVLATLSDAYEGAHFPCDRPDPIDAIKVRMEQMGAAAHD